jgi:copper chaperone CopZ
MKTPILCVLGLAAAATLYIVVTYRGPSYSAPLATDPALLEAPPDHLSLQPRSEETVRVFQVEGMCCRGCSGKLYQALTAVPGVREACVDFERGTASALAASDVAVSRLQDALTFEKYRATPLP